MKSFLYSIVFGVTLNDKAIVGKQIDSNGKLQTNYITASMSYLKDPYVDIGSNPTEEDLKKAISTFDYENIAYTYGVKITNTDKANNNTLSGATFGIFTDSECKNQVGESFTVNSDGQALFKGINNQDVYYIKQLSAPNGYKLAANHSIGPEVAEVSLGDDGYYTVTITNEKQGFLPSTGGIGTVIYTFIGLLIIVIGSLAFVSYRKKASNN